MNRVKTRNLLILVHLFLAAFLAPAFFMVAITGAMDLIGIEASTTDTPIDLTATAAINPDSATIEADIAALLAERDIAISFESLRIRPDTITTRPTSREFVRFTQQDGVWSASLIQPGLQYRLMELHKGHGPEMFKLYSIASGVALFLVILGGLLVGLLAKAYRTKTLVASGVGAAGFLLLGFML